MYSKLVDIVIPVYNKAKFLRELCIKLQELEESAFNIIFIDDGSTDKSCSIINEFALGLENFYLFNKNNGGVSSARNLGISKCLSKYIWFVDPDDSIKKKWINNLDEIVNADADVIIFDYVLNNVATGTVECVKFNDSGIHPNSYFLVKYDALRSENKNMNILWNKWYRRDFIKEIHFDEEIHLGEDRLFNMQVFKKKGKTYFSKNELYDYFLYESDTLSTSINLSKVKDIYYVNHVNLKIMDFDRYLCKKHIFEQLKMRARLEDKNLINFYFKEHNILGVKVFPFFNIAEFLLILCLYTKIYYILIWFYDFLKRSK